MPGSVRRAAPRWPSVSPWPRGGRPRCWPARCPAAAPRTADEALVRLCLVALSRPWPGAGCRLSPRWSEAWRGLGRHAAPGCRAPAGRWPRAGWPRSASWSLRPRTPRPATTTPTSSPGCRCPSEPSARRTPRHTTRSPPSSCAAATPSGRLAAAELGPGRSPAAVTDRWRQIYQRNRGVIGADPDLIRPGQLLRLPHLTTHLTTGSRHDDPPAPRARGHRAGHARARPQPAARAAGAARRRSAPHQRGRLEQWVHRYVQAAVEIVGGDRPASQLLRWTTGAVYADLHRRALLVARAGGHQPGVRPGAAGPPAGGERAHLLRQRDRRRGQRPGPLRRAVAGAGR